jgi:epoxyqueuosine reductase
MTTEQLTESLKSEATRLGFALVGVCPAVTPAGLDRLHEWLDRGFAGQMDYFQKRRDAYAHPSNVLRDVHSIVMLGTPYLSTEPQPTSAGKGRISRYAWSGLDYHDLIHERMDLLIQHVKRHEPAASCRAVSTRRR